MEAKETDKLFRDKLKNHISAPKADSWDRLDLMLDKTEKKPLFAIWRVAAVILLLVVSGWVAFNLNSKEDIKPEIAEVKKTSEPIGDSPEMISQHNPETFEQTQQEQEVITPQVEVVKSVDVPKKQNSVQKEKVKETQPTLEERQITITQEEPQLAQTESIEEETDKMPEKKKIKTIKITYKRGSKSLPKQEEMLAEHKMDTTGTGGKKIKEIWEQTREIKPGDVWADIRDAKDNLFQRNSKKNNVKNLNK